MKFALHNPSFLPTTGDPRDVWPELRDRAQWAEAVGFDYFSVMDHMWQIPGIGSPDEPFLEGWMALAALAEATHRLKLTTLVTGVGYRNPALVVKMVTTLDLISGGRAILGIGGGWNRKEFDAYGYSIGGQFPRPGVRLAQLREAIHIAKAMWAGPRASYQGRHFAVNDVPLEPKPLQQPRPRILIGGEGERVTLRIMAQEADMTNFFTPGPEAFAHKLEVLRRHCQDVGRDPAELELTVLDHLRLGPTAERAEEKWRQRGARDRSGYRGLLGSPGVVIKQVRAYQEAGVQGLFLMVPNDDDESRELLAREVMPAFHPPPGPLP